MKQLDKLYSNIILENEQLIINQDIKSILAGGLIAANALFNTNTLDAKEIKTPKTQITLTKPSDNYTYEQVINYGMRVIKILEGTIKNKHNLYVTYDDLNPTYTLNLRKETFETFKSKCKGKPTIGYGQTEDQYVQKGLMTEYEVNTILRKRIIDIYSKLEKELGTDFTYLSILQKGMLISLYYNLGTDFSKTPKLIQALKDHNYQQAAKQFLDCNKMTINGKKQEVKGLTNRRNRESRIFQVTPQQLQEYLKKQKSQRRK